MPTKYFPYTNPKLDGRRKVTEETKQLIKEMYHEQGKSQRAIARYFQIDKGTVKAIIDPKWYKEKQQKRYKKKPWLDYYDKDKRKLAIRKTRAKKRLLNHTNHNPNQKKICPYCLKSFITSITQKRFCTNKHAQTHYNHNKR